MLLIIFLISLNKLLYTFKKLSGECILIIRIFNFVCNVFEYCSCIIIFYEKLIGLNKNSYITTYVKICKIALVVFIFVYLLTVI